MAVPLYSYIFRCLFLFNGSRNGLLFNYFLGEIFVTTKCIVEEFLKLNTDINVPIKSQSAAFFFSN